MSAHDRLAAIDARYDGCADDEPEAADIRWLLAEVGRLIAERDRLWSDLLAGARAADDRRADINRLRTERDAAADREQELRRYIGDLEYELATANRELARLRRTYEPITEGEM